MGKEQRSLLVTMLSIVSTKLRTIALQQSHSLSNIKLMSTMSSNLLFRQLFDRESCTYTYLLTDKVSKDAVLIDPVIELSERDASLVKDLGLKLKYVMNTHVHADHITGTGRLKDGDKIVFGSHSLEVAETPGHTEGCVTYINKEAGCAFTGDTLLVRGCGRTDFQGGSADTLYSSVWSRILSLPDNTTLYPAHDYKGQTASTVGEEKKFNPRLTKTREEFITLMGNLNLAYPNKIDMSLPANMVCGLHQLPENMADWV